MWQQQEHLSRQNRKQDEWRRHDHEGGSGLADEARNDPPLQPDVSGISSEGDLSPRTYRNPRYTCTAVAADSKVHTVPLRHATIRVECRVLCCYELANMGHCGLPFAQMTALCFLRQRRSDASVDQVGLLWCFRVS